MHVADAEGKYVPIEQTLQPIVDAALLNVPAAQDKQLEELINELSLGQSLHI